MGLHANIYRNTDFPDCSNYGISGKYHQVCVVNCEGNDEPDESPPPVMLVPGIHFGKNLPLPDVVPVDAELYAKTGQMKRPRGYHMMGGTYVHTSDARFGEKVRDICGATVYGYAAPFHDRTE